MVKSGVSCYTNEPTAIMFINGVKCRVTVDISYDDHAMPVDAKVQIETVSESEPICTNQEKISQAYYKFGGWPDFVQNKWEPVADDGTPYTYICTVECNWGDSGNGNVFALIRRGQLGFVVEDVFVEASCC